MRRYYTEPELEIRKYTVTSDYVTTSQIEEDKDLNDDTEYPLFGN